MRRVSNWIALAAGVCLLGGSPAAQGQSQPDVSTIWLLVSTGTPTGDRVVRTDADFANTTTADVGGVESYGALIEPGDYVGVVIPRTAQLIYKPELHKFDATTLAKTKVADLDPTRVKAPLTRPKLGLLSQSAFPNKAGLSLREGVRGSPVGPSANCWFALFDITNGNSQTASVPTSALGRSLFASQAGNPMLLTFTDDHYLYETDVSANTSRQITPKEFAASPEKVVDAAALRGFFRHVSGVHAQAFSQDGTAYKIVLADGTVTSHALDVPNPASAFRVDGAAYSPAADRFAISIVRELPTGGVSTPTIYFYDGQLTRLPGTATPNSQLTEVRFCPNGNELLTVTRDGRLTRYHAPDGALLRTSAAGFVSSPNDAAILGIR